VSCPHSARHGVSWEKNLGVDGDEIAEVFDSWDAEWGTGKHSSLFFWEGPRLTVASPEGNLLTSISGTICRTKSPVDSSYLLHQIRDVVVQDANDLEGT
jgi:hypothetical protein